MQFAPEIIIKLSLAMGMFVYLSPHTKLSNREHLQQDVKSDLLKQQGELQKLKLFKPKE